jgi:hypothetical protein
MMCDGSSNYLAPTSQSSWSEGKSETKSKQQSPCSIGL